MRIQDDQLTYGRIADEWSQELAEAKAPGRLSRDEIFHEMLKALWRGDFESDKGKSCLSIARPPKDGGQRADGRFTDAKHELVKGRYEPVNRRWLLAATPPVDGLSLPHKSRLWPSGEIKGDVSWADLKNEIPWDMLIALRPDEYDHWFRRSYLEKLSIPKDRFGEWCTEQGYARPKFWFDDKSSKTQYQPTQQDRKRATATRNKNLQTAADVIWQQSLADHKRVLKKEEVAEKLLQRSDADDLCKNTKASDGGLLTIDSISRRLQLPECAQKHRSRQKAIRRA